MIATYAEERERERGIENNRKERGKERDNEFMIETIIFSEWFFFHETTEIIVHLPIDLFKKLHL